MKIAISGKANSGKDTVAKLLVTALNLKNYKISSFADPIKQTARLFFPKIQYIDLYGPSVNRSNLVPGESITVRELLINIGENFKAINPNIWVNNFSSTLEECIKTNTDIIVTDLRFKSEFDFLKKENFFLIRVIRPGISVINNSTETEQDQLSNDKFDFILNNSNSLEDLKLNINALVKIIYNI